MAASAAVTAATYQASSKRKLTRGDLRVILQSQALRVASRHHGALTDENGAPVELDAMISKVGCLLDDLVDSTQGKLAAG